MAYIVPRVLIQQEFTQVPVFGDQPLSALVFGPQYNLYRYNKADEKAQTAVTHPTDATLGNAYQALEDTVYNFPNRVSGTFVDADYVKVYFEDAQVEYYPSDLGSTTGEVDRVAHPTLSGVYYSNRFSADNLVFKTANGTDRSADFSNRNIAAGDRITLTDAADADNTVEVRVKAVHASTTAAVVGTITNGTDNAATAVEDYNNAPVWEGEGSAPTGPDNVSTGYLGYPELGIVTDTYLVTCTVTDTDIANCEFTISSTNGAFADKTGQQVDGSDILEIDDFGSSDKVLLDWGSATIPEVGDAWSVSVVAPVTRLASGSTITAALPFRGTRDTTYKLKVVRGGPLYDGTNATTCARIAITSNQLDSSPTVNVAASTAFKVGSYGLTATITAGTSGDQLILGDEYFIPMTASTASDVNIIETYETLPATLTAGTANWEITSMRYVDFFEVASAIDADSDLFNWEVDDIAQSITIYQGIQTVNNDILEGTDYYKMDVKSAKVYVEHRDLVVTNSLSIGSVNFTDEVEAVLGTIDPDNPLAQGVYNAALNANGVETYYCAVATNDLSGYSNVLELARKSENYYGLVPLTFDRVIQDAVVAHVNAESTAERAHWRVAWLSTPLTETEVLYSEQEDSSAWLGTITDDPFATGTQYKLLTVDGATFLTDGIRATDSVRINFRLDPDGNTIYDTYTVEEVRTETTLVITTALDAPITPAIKVEIARNYTKDEQIDTLALVGGEFNNRRVRMVFPPTAANGSVEQEGFQVAAALAGLRAGVVPHQGLTNTELLGFSDLSLSVNGFTETQLNRLAAEGYFIATQSAVGATPYVRHQLTTDEASLNTSEDSITTNVDSISYGLQRAASPFIGTYNIHPKAMVLLRNVIEGELNYRATSTYTVRAGNQLNGYEITTFQQNPTFKDRVDVEVVLDVPYPMNFITIKLIV